VLILFSYQDSTQRNANSLLCHCSDVSSDLELMVLNSEEECDDEDHVVANRPLTLKRMSLAFTHIEEALDVVIVHNCMCSYSQEYLQLRSYYLHCDRRITIPLSACSFF
jgi:hypothetical protein